MLDPTSESAATTDATGLTSDTPEEPRANELDRFVMFELPLNLSTVIFDVETNWLWRKVLESNSFKSKPHNAAKSLAEGHPK